MSAPANIATTDPKPSRRTWVRTSGERRVRGETGERQREDGRRQVGCAQSANGRVSDAHRRGGQRDDRPALPECPTEGHSDRGDRRAGEQQGLARRCDHQPLTTRSRLHGNGQAAPSERARQEADESEHRCADRKAFGTGDREGGEHDVAGHVGREDMSEAQKCDGVDETGRCRQEQKRGYEQVRSRRMPRGVHHVLNPRPTAAR